MRDFDHIMKHVRAIERVHLHTHTHTLIPIILSLSSFPHHPFPLILHLQQNGMASVKSDARALRKEVKRCETPACEVTQVEATDTDEQAITLKMCRLCKG